jgi:hypothetical protein
MPDPLYVPVLKGRQGELAALGEVQPTTRRHVLPLVEIVPGPIDDPDGIRVVINKTCMKLRAWRENRLLLDAGLLPTDIEVGDGGPLRLAATTAIRSGIHATPVVRLGDEPLAHADAAFVHREHGSGVAVRLNTEDMDEDPEDVDQGLADVLWRLGISRSDADLVLDVGAVGRDLVRAQSRLVTDLLRDLKVDEWRQIIVTAGAFPVDLSVVAPWVLGEPRRYDAVLWDQLQGRRRIIRKPTYGDYAIAHPTLASGPPFPPAPQLRYTVSTCWLVLKGERRDPRGHEQFYEVCEKIAQHDEFAGEALGWADKRIANARVVGKPGNATTWRQIGTTHHLDYVVRRLTTLGEP